MQPNPTYADWGTDELISARDKIQDEYFKSSRAGRLIFDRILTDLNVEIVVRNLAQMDARP